MAKARGFNDPVLGLAISTAWQKKYCQLIAISLVRVTKHCHDELIALSSGVFLGWVMSSIGRNISILIILSCLTAACQNTNPQTKKASKTTKNAKPSSLPASNIANDIRACYGPPLYEVTDNGQTTWIYQGGAKFVFVGHRLVQKPEESRLERLAVNDLAFR